MILVTGSSGLIGRAISSRLRASNKTVRQFDIANSADQNILNADAIEAAMESVEGIVHLAAVSRVVWAQHNPELAWATNVNALSHLLSRAGDQKCPPWVVFASSREVYGEPEVLPVPETAPLRPLNIYARSKVAGEDLVQGARARGMTMSIARFSNVYGCIHDHPDRVVPAFARAAATAGPVRIEGAENMFDFTHIDDVARGLELLIEATQTGTVLPPVHFVSGQGTTLGQLADLAACVSQGKTDALVCPARSYDVARFTGDPSFAARSLGWKPEIGIKEGFQRLAADFMAADGSVLTT